MPHYRFRLDLLAIRYLDALDAEDWPAIADLWHRAESDPALLLLLREVDSGLIAEGPREAHAAATAAEGLRGRPPAARN